MADLRNVFANGDIVYQNDNPKQWVQVVDIEYDPTYDYTSAVFHPITRKLKRDERWYVGWSGLLQADKYTVVRTGITRDYYFDQPLRVK